jgi:hypothetical protein
MNLPWSAYGGFLAFSSGNHALKTQKNYITGGYVEKYTFVQQSHPLYLWNLLGSAKRSDDFMVED